METIAKRAVDTATEIKKEASYFPIIFEPDGSLSITNSGTAAAAARLTMIPQNDIMLLTIEGMSEEKIQMEKIKAGQLLVIDGINRKITLDAKDAFENYHGWEFPKLQPGVNKIKITNADTSNLTIEYQPRYI